MEIGFISLALAGVLIATFLYPAIWGAPFINTPEYVVLEALRALDLKPGVKIV